MNQAEFSVSTDLTPLRQFSIQANFEEVQAWLEKSLAPYRTMLVTAENLSQCKADRAKINRIIQTVEDSRKTVKKAVMTSYLPFEAQCKKLVSLLNEAADNLGNQISEMDRNRREARKGEMEALFREQAADLLEKGLCAFSQVWEDSWSNATASREKCREALEHKIHRIRTEAGIIVAQGSRFEVAMLSMYSKEHDLAGALSYGKRLEEMEQKAAAQRPVVKKEEPPAGTAAPQKPENPPPEEAEERFRVVFAVWATERQLKELSAYLRREDIPYGRPDDIPQAQG